MDITTVELVDLLKSDVITDKITMIEKLYFRTLTQKGPSEALMCATLIQSLGETHNHPRGEILGTLLCGHCYYELGKHEDSYHCCTTILNNVEAQNNLDLYSETLFLLGQNSTNRYKKNDHLAKACECIKTIDTKKYCQYILHYGYSLAENNRDKAYQCYQEVAKILSTENYTQDPIIYSVRIQLLMKLRKYSDINTFFNDINIENMTTLFVLDKVRIIHAQALYHHYQQNSGVEYTLFKQCLELLKDKNFYRIYGEIAYQYALSLYMNKQECSTLLEEALEIFKTLNKNTQYQHCASLLSTLYESTGNYQKALYFERKKGITSYIRPLPSQEYQEVKSTYETLSHQLKQLYISDNPVASIRELLQMVKEQSHCTTLVLFLKERNSVIFSEFAFTQDDEVDTQWFIYPNEGILGYLTHANSQTSIDNIFTHPNFIASDLPIGYSDKNIKSLYHYPISIHNEVVGFIALWFTGSQFDKFKRNNRRIEEVVTHIIIAQYIGSLQYECNEAAYNAEYMDSMFQHEIKVRQEVEVDLMKANERTQNANKAKDLFLANVSHEVRTPLNGIIGYAEMLLKETLPQTSKQYVDTIIKESEHLLALINDILDHSKIESGKLELEMVHIDLEDFLHQIRDILGSTIQQKGVPLIFKIDKLVHKSIIGDPLRLKQILINLANNALKFTSKGSVTISITLVESQEDNQVIKFSVIDTGIGIPKNKLSTIFENFTQAEKNTSRKYGGTGLGTAIALKLVQLMGSTINVHSTEGEGSTFSFLLKTPIASSHIAQEISKSKETVPEKKRSGIILAAEDYPINQKVIISHLQSAGYSLLLVDNGLKAYEATNRQKFDLILMDMQMPKMNGDQAALLIRTKSTFNQNTPIIGITANADTVSKELCLKSGMNKVITKPLRKKELLKEVSQWMNPSENTTENQELSTTPKDTPPVDIEKILAEFGTLDIFKETAYLFVNKGAEQLKRIEKGWHEGDINLLKEEIHALKGGALTLDAIEVSNQAKLLENLCLEHYCTDNTTVLLKLIEEFNRFSTFVESL